GSRDARMRELISKQITVAATKRTAPTFAEATHGSEASDAKAVAQVDAKPEPKRTAKAEAAEEPKSENAGKAEAKPAPQMALAAATSTPARVTSSANAPGQNMPAESAHAAAAT